VEVGEPRLPQLMPDAEQMDAIAVDMRIAGVLA
jgi:4-hydroxy-tetrahydrodipicolinate synthase